MLRRLCLRNPWKIENSKITLRRLRNLHKKKLKKKQYNTKSQKESDGEKEENQEKQKSPEDIEAQKLAEKYY